MRYRHTDRPGFLLGFIDFFTAGLFFLLYMPFGGLQRELEEILGHKLRPYWKAYLLGIPTFFIYTLVWMAGIAEELKAKAIELGIEGPYTSYRHMFDWNVFGVLFFGPMIATRRFFDTLNKVEKAYNTRAAEAESAARTERSHPMKKILIALETGEKEQAAFRRAAEAAGVACEFTFTTHIAATREQIAEACFIVGNVSPRKIAASANLDVLQLFSAGADPYMPAGVLADKTVLCNATGAYGQAVSEHAFAMTLMLIKKLHLYRSSQLKCRWEDHGMVTSLAGATVLVVGLGDIGLSYARLVKALGARVIGVKRRSGVCPEGVDEMVLTEEIDRVLPLADVVMSVLPSTAETAYFYTAERFEKMKNSAVFINCGRGNAVSHEVLLHALRSGEIAAAAIDVCETEPLPADSPLWQEEKLVITPHVAGNFHLASIYEGIIDIAVENLTNYLSGKPLRNIVDPLTGYKR